MGLAGAVLCTAGVLPPLLLMAQPMPRGLDRLDSSAQRDVLASARSVGPMLRLSAARPASAVAARHGWPYELTLERDCAALFEYKKALNRSVWPPVPFERLSDALVRNYTIQGRAFVADWFWAREEEHADGGKPHAWREQAILKLVKAMQHGACPSAYNVPEPCQALRAHPPAGRGAVIGSQSPWLEAAILAFGGQQVTSLTTVEYSPTTCVPRPEPAATRSRSAASPASVCARLGAVGPREWMVHALRTRSLGQLDFVASYSSLEHDGLGRYGDPLNPAADLESMQTVHCMLRPGGIFYFGAPMDARQDTLVWNAHRIYGPLRRALASANFKVLDVVGGVRSHPWLYTGQQHSQHAEHGLYPAQPLVVLQSLPVR